MEGVDPGIAFIAEQNRQLYRSREVIDVVAYLAANGAEIGRRRVDRIAAAYFRRDAYTAQQLSDTYGLEPARFSLIASEVFEEMREADNLQKMLGSLYEIRQAAPALHMRSPSVLETIAYWYALREMGTHLSKTDTNTWRTAVTHFTMPTRFLPVGNKIVTTVPYSTLDTDPDDSDQLDAVVYPEDVENPDEPHFPRLAIS